MSAAQKIKIVPAWERTDYIAKAMAGTKEWEKFYFFQSTETKLPVIRVPNDLLLYRLENYRTRDTQLSMVAHGQFEDGFFDKTRHEDLDVQRAQHDILLDFAKRGKGEDVTPIWDELARRGNQTDNLLITVNGVVVNGNRRLCAMRELFSNPEAKHQSFSHVNCMVLPEHASEDDILEVEIRLQMAPETKLRYSWITIALACRDLRDHDHPKAQIADWMMIDESRIDREIAKLEYSEIYLKEWLGRAKDYSLLDRTEQAFTQMATRNNARTKSVEHREIAQKIDFFLIENRSMIEDRAYEFINTIEANTTAFLEQLADAAGIDLQDKEIVSGQLEIDIGGSEAIEKDFFPIGTALRDARGDAGKVNEYLQQITSICEFLNEQKRSKNKAAIRFARAALQKLISIDLLTADPASLGDLQNVVEEIESRAADLLLKLKTD